jgi:hypothetical protein
MRTYNLSINPTDQIWSTLGVKMRQKVPCLGVLATRRCQRDERAGSGQLPHQSSCLTAELWP